MEEKLPKYTSIIDDYHKQQQLQLQQQRQRHLQQRGGNFSGSGSASSGGGYHGSRRMRLYQQKQRRRSDGSQDSLLSSSSMGGGSSWGESTISRRFKVDNDILEHEPELAKLMFDKSTGLNKQDIDRIAASATHLDIAILGKSLSVWTCPYWSHVMQRPEFFLVHTIDGDTRKYRQRGSGSSSGSGSGGSNAGNDGGNSSNSGSDITISYSPPPPPTATTPTAAADTATDDDGIPVDEFYSSRYDKACEQVLGTVTEVKEKIETTVQYVRSICNLTSAWVHNCVTMAPYIKIIKYHVLMECNIDPITNRDRNRNT
jgi:hypothetical protein